MTTSDDLALIRACIPALRRYAWTLARDRDDADDLVHDCLVRALAKLHTRRDDADVRAWLFTILHNQFVSQHRRKRTRAGTIPLTEDHEDTVSTSPTQEDRLLWRDLMRALDRLPEEQRNVVLLISVEDLSYAQTAQVLGIPIGTVMSRLARARERLREYTGSTTRTPLRRVK